MLWVVVSASRLTGLLSNCRLRYMMSLTGDHPKHDRARQDN